MPPVTKTSKLSQKYGAKLDQAIQNHAGDDTNYGFIRLPGGILSGVAQLRRAYFEKYKEGDNKDEYYFRAVGVVITPEEALDKPSSEGGMLIRIAGLTTSLMIPVCDAKRYGRQMTMEENVADILNHMRRLTSPDFTEGASVDDLEDLAAEIEDMGPYFSFSTEWSFAKKDDPQKNIRKGMRLEIVNEKWNGNRGLEDYIPSSPKKATVLGGAASQEVKQESEAENNGELKHGKEVVENRVGIRNKMMKASKSQEETVRTDFVDTKVSKPKDQKPKKEIEEAEENEDAFVEDVEIDLDGLAQDADSDSDSASESGQTLVKIAIGLGIDEKVAKKTKSWEELVKMIREKDNEEGEGSPDAEGKDGDESVDKRDEEESEVGEEEKSEEESEKVDSEEEAEEQEAVGPKLGEECYYKPTDPKTKKPVAKAVKCEITSVDYDDEIVDLRCGKAIYKNIKFDKLIWEQ